MSEIGNNNNNNQYLSEVLLEDGEMIASNLGEGRRGGQRVVSHLAIGHTNIVQGEGVHAGNVGVGLDSEGQRTNWPTGTPTDEPTRGAKRAASSEGVSNGDCARPDEPAPSPSDRGRARWSVTPVKPPTRSQTRAVLDQEPLSGA